MAVRGRVRVLRSSDVAAVLDWPSVVRAVEASYADLGTQRWRVSSVSSRLADHRGWIRALVGSHSGSSAGILAYTAGARGGFPQKVCLVFSLRDGGLLAIVEADRTAWMRSGATVAVATRHLARPNPTRLALIGTGRQARAHAFALFSEFPDASLAVFSRSTAHRALFADEVAREAGRPVDPVDNVDALVADSDVITTATTSATPVFDSSLVALGAHVNAVGAHHPDRQEVDSHLVKRARLFVDDPERALSEDGDILIPLRSGEIPKAHVIGTLGDVIAGTVQARLTPEDVTVFSSGGVASEHIAVSLLAYERAEERDLGITVDFPNDYSVPSRLSDLVR